MTQFSFHSKNEMRNIDHCAIGPLTCGLGEEFASNKEDFGHFFSTATDKAREGFGQAFRRASSVVDTTTRYESSDLVEDTKQRLSEFQSRGWLSQQEYRKHMNLLQRVPVEKGNRDQFEKLIRVNIVQELDRLEENLGNGSSSTATKKEKSHPLGESKAEWSTNQNKSASILTYSNLRKRVGQKEIEEMFVEMCFFARLGFVQPPCCLKCNYKQSHQDENKLPKECTRWTVWRKDIKHIVHPKHVRENTVFVQCHAARQLLEGCNVDGHQWNEKRKHLLFPKATQA